MKLNSIELTSKLYTLAQEYKNNLCYRKVIFVSFNLLLDAVFLPQHFLHLTGVSTSKTPGDFYDAALNKRLIPSEVQMRKDGTTKLKLSVLPQLFSLPTTAKMIGACADVRMHLKTDALAGTTSACMGFKKTLNHYIPNTALKVDIRREVERIEKLLFVAVSLPGTEQEAYKILRQDIRDTDKLPLGKYRNRIIDHAVEAQANSTYCGAIVGVHGGDTFQETPDGLVRHDAAHLSRQLRVGGTPLRIAYCRGKCFIDEAKYHELTKDQGLEQ